ncbi:unnamed protein product, partial [Ectocarpus sp. 8 AP-2014]
PHRAGPVLCYPILEGSALATGKGLEREEERSTTQPSVTARLRQEAAAAWSAFERFAFTAGKGLDREELAPDPPVTARLRQEAAESSSSSSSTSTTPSSRCRCEIRSSIRCVEVS